MGYYLRAFCQSPNTPPPKAVLAWMRERGFTGSLDVQENLPESDNHWTAATLSYKDGKEPIEIECNRRDGPESLADEEIQEFIEFIGPSGRSSKKKRVVDHLTKTTFVVACCLPTLDIDEDGYDANEVFLTYFVEHCGGLIQADGEGFWDGDKVIVRLE